MNDKEKISDLLSFQPLYKKVQVDIDFLKHPTDLNDLSFNFYCPIDNNYQTFKLAIEPENLFHLWEKQSSADTRNDFKSFDNIEMKYRFTQHYSATCQFCEKYRAEFLLNVETDSRIPINDLNQTKPLQIVKKIGQNPAYQISPDKKIISFLTKEDQENYKKSLICLSQNYGIAAFAYLRRIVENEMIRIVEDLSKLDRPESEKIKMLLEDFKQKHIMSNLIDGIYVYLPNSLRNFGSNPLKLLYGQLSGGIHQLTEEECYNKAFQLDTLLKFIVKKIYEENSEIREVRDAMEALR